MLNILIQAFHVFSRGFMTLKWYWIVWVYVLIIVNGLTPLFLLPKFTAVIVLVASCTGLVSGLVLTHALGFSKVLGLMHFPWIPAVCFQIYYLSQQDYVLINFHDYWLLMSLILSSLSLIIDFKDVYEFILTPNKL